MYERMLLDIKCNMILGARSKKINQITMNAFLITVQGQERITCVSFTQTYRLKAFTMPLK